MGFFDLKAMCSICEKQVGLNRYFIKKSDVWICPKCFKKAGGPFKVNLAEITIEDLHNIINPPKPTPVKRIFEHVLEFNSAGVTFENRQDTLKRLFNSKENIEVEFKVVDFKGKPAVRLFVKDSDVGWVPKNWLNTFLQYKDWNYRTKQARVYKVYNKNGSFACYGLSVSFAFTKD